LPRRLSASTSWSTVSVNSWTMLAITYFFQT
jgi:hypothetical protein